MRQWLDALHDETVSRITLGRASDRTTFDTAPPGARIWQAGLVGEEVEREIADDRDAPDSRARAFIETGGRVVGGAAGAAVGLIGGPFAAVAGGAAGAAIGDMLAAAGVEFYQRVLGPRQGQRAAGALAVATVEIHRRLEAGEVPRSDFVDDGSEDSNAAEILEGTLLTAANAFEQRKVEFIGRFYANLAFREDISASYASLLLRFIDRLTFGQFRAMAVLGNEEHRQELLQLGAERKEGAFRSDVAVVAELDELSAMGLIGIAQTDGTVVPIGGTFGGSQSWSTMELWLARLTESGQLLHDLLGLTAMDADEERAVLALLRGKNR